MQCHTWRLLSSLLFAAGCVAQDATPTRALTWQETQAEFKIRNPTLLAGQASVDESRADEITAHLRPNPSLTFTADSLAILTYNPFRPFANLIPSGSVDYLHEREHKRELRLASAQQATGIAVSTQADLERNLMYNLRDAFVRVLVAKAVLGVALENLDYYDKEISINRERYQTGGIARVDFQRVELQRVQFESDVATAQVNVRTAKIDLLTLLRDRAPVEQFDVSEPFDFSDSPPNLEDLRQLAINNRPDLKEAEKSLDKARTDHQLAVANGSSDPTFGFDVARQVPVEAYVGFSISFPLRIFDKNQGEKLRTQIDIGRTEKLRDAAEAGVLHDVDSAYATLQSTLQLLRPYKAKYLQEAKDVRETISFSYLHGAASLLDFLDAQKQYRNTELSYLSLVGAYLSAANQVNFAVGREVIR
ncbi:MAG TPA: TolC family protein [Bryobacteraceae bacterium]